MRKSQKRNIHWPITTLVEITWRDANATNMWVNLSDSEGLTCPMCKSIGYLIKITKSDIIIADTQAPRHQGTPAQCAGFLTIPRDWVGEIKYIRK